ILSSTEPLADGEPKIAPDDTAELVFTSGTTGNPKGVILAHRNIAANALMSADAVPPTPKHHPLSILPLSHMFEQTGGLFAPLTGGASLTYISSLRPDVIFDALKTHRITNMSCVPQVLQLFKDGIEREVRRQNKSRQFERLRNVSSRLPLPMRRLLFRKVRQRMGGKFDFFIVGGAFLDPELARWWESLGLKVIQGYGMTEASPVVTCNRLNDRDPDSVGRPLKGVEVKILDDYEILVRGENVSPGYWNDAQATAEAFEDGWYRTGDLGQFDKKGRLRLRGRKKNMIVLANGMNVYPEDIERALTTDPRVKDAVVLGLTKGQDVEIHAVLLTTETEGAPDTVRAANALLASHQHIHGFTVWPDETFPLTPTLKPKRADIAARLAEIQSQKAKA
ncbi:MAG: AMP-binding protein, partial [Ardenticatenaceae bacterium]